MSDRSSSAWWWPALLALTLAAPANAAGRFATPIDLDALDRVRGGFASSDAGVAMSFNVQQSVYVNGSLAAASGVSLAQDGTLVSVPGTSPALVQIGSGNLAPTGLAAATTIVQNSLDNQKIQTVTTIDVSAQILGAYRSMHLQSMLTGAITGSLRR